jgi:chromatin assembly factor 1 subunit B
MIYPNVISSTATPAVPGLEVTPHPPRVVYLSTLKRHTAPVNVVRWSPSGMTLASAGDGESS